MSHPLPLGPDGRDGPSDPYPETEDELLFEITPHGREVLAELADEEPDAGP